MFDMNQFDRLLAQAVNEQHGHGRIISHSLGEFFRYAQTSTSYLNGRQSYYSQRLECEELTTQDLKATLQQTTNNMGILAAVQASKLQTFRAVRNLDELKISELQDRLERALDSEEQTAQQNNILLSQMSALKNQHTILNPINWGKGQWYSFAIGVAVGEQAIEQFTDYKPIRRLVSRGAKKLFGKPDSQKQVLPESFKPAMTEEYGAHVSVPAVPVVQVHS